MNKSQNAVAEGKSDGGRKRVTKSVPPLEAMKEHCVLVPLWFVGGIEPWDCGPDPDSLRPSISPISMP